MTELSTPAVQVSAAKTAEASVTRHDVTFQFKVLALAGAPVTEDSGVYKALSVSDEDLFSKLPLAVSGWRYLDNYRIECDRLEICQPEFGYDEELPDGTLLYDVTVSASHELPTLRSEATDERPVSVQQLAEEVPALLVTLYGQGGVTLALHRVQYYKEYKFTAQGTYSLR